MTTNELRDNIVEYLEINRHTDVDGNIKIKDSEKTVIKAFIQQAKSEWCKEQRENCALKYHECYADDCFFDYTKDEIKNAPEP